MILEGIVTTRSASGRVNIAPMGPDIDEAAGSLRLRPFKSSQTYRNLKEAPCGVFHVVDDVLLLARAAIDRFDEPPETFPAVAIAGDVLTAACRWFEFEIVARDESGERTDLSARVVHRGRLRDFFGFNRAKHAVVEAAILATRVHILPREEILQKFAELRVPVEKTAGPAESEAFELLYRFVSKQTHA